MFKVFIKKMLFFSLFLLQLRISGMTKFPPRLELDLQAANHNHNYNYRGVSVLSRLHGCTSKLSKVPRKDRDKLTGN